MIHLQSKITKIETVFCQTQILFNTLSFNENNLCRICINKHSTIQFFTLCGFKIIMIFLTYFYKYTNVKYKYPPNIGQYNHCLLYTSGGIRLRERWW